MGFMSPGGLAVVPNLSRNRSAFEREHWHYA
jgi:hypothetical protein